MGSNCNVSMLSKKRPFEGAFETRRNIRRLDAHNERTEIPFVVQYCTVENVSDHLDGSSTGFLASVRKLGHKVGSLF